MDPIPRLIHLLMRFPNFIQYGHYDSRKESNLYIFLKREQTTSNLDGSLTTLENASRKLYIAKLSTITVGLQYIWCGKHKEWYYGEQMKIRNQGNIVCSYGDEGKKFRNATLSIWQQMFEDHHIEEYLKRISGKTSLI